jgi:hypothetical protein
MLGNETTVIDISAEGNGATEFGRFTSREGTGECRHVSSQAHGLGHVDAHLTSVEHGLNVYASSCSNLSQFSQAV